MEVLPRLRNSTQAGPTIKSPTGTEVPLKSFLKTDNITKPIAEPIKKEKNVTFTPKEPTPTYFAPKETSIIEEPEEDNIVVDDSPKKSFWKSNTVILLVLCVVIIVLIILIMWLASNNTKCMAWFKGAPKQQMTPQQLVALTQPKAPVQVQPDTPHANHAQIVKNVSDDQLDKFANMDITSTKFTISEPEQKTEQEDSEPEKSDDIVENDIAEQFKVDASSKDNATVLNDYIDKLDDEESIRIEQYKNGKFIKMFSTKDELEQAGFDYNAVIACCKGEQKTHKNYEWKYC